MAERMERLFQIFQEAVESEKQSRQRYEEAAVLCDDAALKEVLLRFAEDERRHEQEVRLRFKEMAERFSGGVN